jgi:hypothetical protein
MRDWKPGFIATAILASLALPAQAQVANCNTHEFVKNKLETEHNEEVIGRGIRSNGIVIELYYSRKNQTWTVVASDPIMSCVMSDGEFWEITAPKAGETES